MSDSDKLNRINFNSRVQKCLSMTGTYNTNNFPTLSAFILNPFSIFLRGFGFYSLRFEDLHQVFNVLGRKKRTFVVYISQDYSKVDTQSSAPIVFQFISLSGDISCLEVDPKGNSYVPESFQDKR